MKDNLAHYLEKYDIWSSYRPEDEGVTIAYASIHGNTAAAARELAALLEEKGQKVSLFDLARDDMAEAIEDAFRYDRLVLAAATYDGGLFPCMEENRGDPGKRLLGSNGRKTDAGVCGEL